MKRLVCLALVVCAVVSGSAHAQCTWTGTSQSITTACIGRSDERLEVRKGASDTFAAGSGLFLGTGPGNHAGLQLSTLHNLDFWMENATSGAWSRPMTLTTGGFLGLGANAPKSLLHLYPTLTNTAGINLRLYEFATLGSTYASWATVLGSNVKASETPGTNQMESMLGTPSYSTMGGAAIYMTYDGNIVFHTKPAPVAQGAAFSSARMRIAANGNVGIGLDVPAATLDVNGSIRANGSITGATVIGAVYQDVAEWVPATTPMTAGTVVVLNRERSNEVMPSARAYDTTVAGVVSANPGVLLGKEGDGKVMIATTGRVKVHVDARRGAVAVGDLLVTSNISGTAMKSKEVDLGGIAIHRPGTILGKALEPLADGEGDILVLLSLQ